MLLRKWIGKFKGQIDQVLAKIDKTINNKNKNIIGPLKKKGKNLMITKKYPELKKLLHRTTIKMKQEFNR